MRKTYLSAISRRSIFTLLLACLTSVGCWQTATAQPAATTVQLPEFGISIDADGVLTSQQQKVDPREFQHVIQQARQAGKDNPLMAGANLRVVSLRALNAAVAADKIPDEVQHLAGLTRVQFVVITANDVLLAGPAEGWFIDPLGRARGAMTGKPILRLDDLAVALRAIDSHRDQKLVAGCSIDPDADGLARLREFQAKIPRTIPNNQRGAAAVAIAKGITEALGDANIRVFGVNGKTHSAAVMIEADYRMKRIGVGLEPPPVKMMTFMKALRTADESRLQRWWFVPNYQCVRLAEDGSAMEMVGQGVELRGEDKVIGPGGQLLQGNENIGEAAQLYCTSFTEKYDEIAAADPVYAELRNVTDLLIAAAFLKRSKAWEKLAWRPENLLSEDVVATETFVLPKTAPCVANAVWKGSRLLAPAGGGVSISPDEAFDEANLLAAPKNGSSDFQPELQGKKDDTLWWDAE